MYIQVENNYVLCYACISIDSAKGAIVWRDSDSTILSKMFEMIKELKEEVNAMKFEIREIKSALQPNPGPGMVTSAKEARL